jgi:hypothetical protein
LHRDVDLASQLLLRGRHSLPQLRQQATCFVTADLVVSPSFRRPLPYRDRGRIVHGRSLRPRVASRSGTHCGLGDSGDVSTGLGGFGSLGVERTPGESGRTARRFRFLGRLDGW